MKTGVTPTTQKIKVDKSKHKEYAVIVSSIKERTKMSSIKTIKETDWKGVKRRLRQGTGVGLLLALSSVAIYQNMDKFSPVQRGGMIFIASALLIYWIFND